MNNSKRKYNRKRRRRRIKALRILIISIGIVILWLIICLIWQICGFLVKTVENHDSAEKDNMVVYESESNNISEAASSVTNQDPIMQKLETFAEQNHFSVSEYPEELIELLRKNSETEDFVLNYPLEKDEFSTDPLTKLLDKDKVPLLMQWDRRWGYYIYGDNVMGLTGCGPTCLSMVAIHLLQNPQLTPAYVAEYSEENGYCVDGSGSSWELMSRGAEGLGLDADEVPLNETTVMKYLEQGKPIICIMGPGEFTDDGHFIVFTGLKNGKIVINDPNSKERSEKLWEFEDIKGQIRNMWVYRKG